MATARNPVLTGFHPDPSMICVDGTFYIANSTFEYFPGVRISASKDLVNWECISTPLDSEDMLDMRGNPDSGGIWAPCLSYSGGMFYLVFTDVKIWCDYPFKDTHNYITTAKDIKGPWSAPIYVNSSGFDPSLFHDEDGRKWFVNMEWDYRGYYSDRLDSPQFTGILLTELDPVTLKPISEPKKIMTATSIGLIEGPHIFRKDGFYYLICAEGGTVYSHAETVARSEKIDGPYAVHPDNPLITALDTDNVLQKTGHASICQAPDGRWWMAFLCGRPLPGTKRCPLGRETAIAELIWKDGWPYLKSGGRAPAAEFEAYAPQTPPQTVRYTFANTDFLKDFNSLRRPAIYSIDEKKGWLRLYGKESCVSRHTQNMLVRRQSDFDFMAETHVCLPFKHFKRMAGMLYRYDVRTQRYLRFAYDERTGNYSLGMLSFSNRVYTPIPREDEAVIPQEHVYMRLTVRGGEGRFSYSLDGREWLDFGPVIDASEMSDDFAEPLGFTGAFVGMTCNDLEDGSAYADFEYFKYEPL